MASFDIASLLDAHRRNNTKVTMALWEVENPSEFGIVGLSASPEGEVDGVLREGFIRRFWKNLVPKKPLAMSSTLVCTFLNPRCLNTFQSVKNLILVSNSSNIA